MKASLALEQSFSLASSNAPRALSALTLAFSCDPVCRWCWSDPDVHLRFFPRFALAFGGAAFDCGTAFVDAEVRGAALWLPPGATPDDPALMDIIDSSVKAAQRATLFAVLEQMAEHHPHGDHWYLPLIGVEPMAQSRGLGRTLMLPALARCDARGLPAYLESTNPKNVPFYERLGFRATGRIKVDDCPEVVPMLRAPSTQR
jgi:ribosomal protein S18 acetylase RimI-like enzyme